MNILKSFKSLTRFEFLLWLISLIVVALSFILAPDNDVMKLIAPLIGVTALIFVAKGFVLGQVLTVVFAVFYGCISFHFHYYGEMITYLCMTAPIAVMSVISWLKHPYKNSDEVSVSRLDRKKTVILWISAVLITVAFYFILSALGNANIVFSTLSVATSFIASYLTLFRSPYYAIGYAANDVVLIVLWILASIESPSYLPMILCFVMFLINDLYGFFNWRRIENKQKHGE